MRYHSIDSAHDPRPPLNIEASRVILYIPVRLNLKPTAGAGTERVGRCERCALSACLSVWGVRIEYPLHTACAYLQRPLAAWGGSYLRWAAVRGLRCKRGAAAHRRLRLCTPATPQWRRDPRSTTPHRPSPCGGRQARAGLTSSALMRAVAHDLVPSVRVGGLARLHAGDGLVQLGDGVEAVEL